MNLSRAQLSDYVNSLNEISAQAKKTLTNNLIAVLNNTNDLDKLHDAINLIAPQIAQIYGSAAGSIAADLWEQIYKSDTGKTAEAIVYDADTTHLFGASSGYAFSDGNNIEPIAVINHVAGTMGRAVLNSARRTMRSNTDRYGGRYARVPTGDKTCAFCLMLASRGFIYRSEDSAGEFDHYHDDCDCEVVASFDTDNSAIEGYDSAEYYKMYSDARAEAGSGDTNDILSKMREMYGFS